MAKRMEPGNVATVNSVRRLLGIPPVKEEEEEEDYAESSAAPKPAAAVVSQSSAPAEAMEV